MEPNLRHQLTELLNELGKLMVVAPTEEEEQKIRRLIRILFAILDEVLKQEIQSNTKKYRDAIAALDESLELADAAKRDLKRIADAINKAVSAAKAVDKVIGLGIDLLV